ncbi:MAG: glycosyltransferase [Tannerella sp.]|nr:glycosyltransferase [Tannerella sp.]
MDKILNVVSLNIPWPANYGGVIDIYCKIKALHDCGVRIILHCFEYERPRAAALAEVCEEVHYYRRRTGLLPNITLLPYNVYSRKDTRLIDNLLKNDCPILFEGLHSCYYLKDERLKNRFKIFRVCNIEHDYYHAVGRAESNLLKKCFYHIEAMRFKRFQKQAIHAELILAISTADRDCLQRTFPHNRVEFVPGFHGNKRITATEGQSDYILYHGKLSVKENEKAAIYLIENVFAKLSSRCIIAGMNPPSAILNAAGRYPHISVEGNPTVERIDALIREAQINLLVTFQRTGLKLKLLNSLFAGRHTVVNSPMLAGSGLDSLCFIADTPDEMIRLCRELMQKPFTPDCIRKRQALLFPAFSDEYNAGQIVRMIYGR